LVAIGACFGATPTATADSVPVTATVLKVVDGDTIDIRNDDRGRLRVRLLGIDTPETKKPGYTVGCWGPEATEFAKSTMVEQRVAVVTDPTQDRTDRYGRTLAYLVRADGFDYSVEAVRAGAAKSYVYGGRPVSRYDAIAAAEKEAMDALRGLWGPPCNGDTASVPLCSPTRCSRLLPRTEIADEAVTFDAHEARSGSSAWWRRARHDGAAPAARKWWPLTDGMFKRAIPVAGNRCPLTDRWTGQRFCRGREAPHLPLIKVPTGFTHGTADPFGSIDELRAAAALIPAPSEIVEVTGARHDLGSKKLDVPVFAVDAALRLLPW
jgi:micrococcal nuclease